MKKFLSAILAVVMILSTAPICRVVDTDFNIILLIFLTIPALVVGIPVWRAIFFNGCAD